ncbi:hypothetical protein PAXRUDRAFT_25812 [Paxillus rubicundulus Ve08.2h10]|uniref:NAD-dependent epimerase/dehydratase domain-containing protein n=1 Tax=Paxillus rubicundulus Ve08.2h10 TaxID=930991 RepID=A0A0D0DXA1_9AGAM|nr:hypothetical protein PAXRUDRAFT_25812 [Paxillus rubicundulus Ve08.2h10]
MPSGQPLCKVLVSGATGYVAAWVVQNLERRYSERYFPDGACDEAVKGVDAIEHTSSPFQSVGPAGEDRLYIEGHDDTKIEGGAQGERKRRNVMSARAKSTFASKIQNLEVVVIFIMEERYIVGDLAFCTTTNSALQSDHMLATCVLSVGFNDQAR